jgi:hypothetical protein
MKMEVTSSFETSNSPKYKRDKPEDQGASFKVSRAVTPADTEVLEVQVTSIFKAEVCKFIERLELCMKFRRLLTRFNVRRKKSASSS